MPRLAPRLRCLLFQHEAPGQLQVGAVRLVSVVGCLARLGLKLCQMQFALAATCRVQQFAFNLPHPLHRACRRML